MNPESTVPATHFYVGQRVAVKICAPAVYRNRELFWSRIYRMGFVEALNGDQVQVTIDHNRKRRWFLTADVFDAGPENQARSRYCRLCKQLLSPASVCRNPECGYYEKT